MVQEKLSRRGPATSYKVLNYLNANPNLNLTVEDVSKNTGLDKSQVQSAMSRLKQRGLNIEVVLAGNCYRYIPTSVTSNGHKNNRKLFEEIGTAKDGRIVIQDTDGNLYVATQL